MYCINCGVGLNDSEKKCPLCNTLVYHPDFINKKAEPLYPSNKIPKVKPKSQVLSGGILILFFIPILISLLSDWRTDGTLEWFGIVAGALILGYIFIGLPIWFKKPNPTIFVPCDFAGTIIYLFYINWQMGGNWFFSFALPITLGLALIVCTVVTLTHYLKKGRLYIWGGALIALGALLLLTEYLIIITFNSAVTFWSLYAFIVLLLVGGTLIYLAINDSAREVMERKLFF